MFQHWPYIHRCLYKTWQKLLIIHVHIRQHHHHQRQDQQYKQDNWREQEHRQNNKITKHHHHKITTATRTKLTTNARKYNVWFTRAILSSLAIRWLVMFYCRKWYIPKGKFDFYWFVNWETECSHKICSSVRPPASGVTNALVIECIWVGLIG